VAKKYAVTKMKPQYRGEDVEGNRVWGTPVRYLSQSERRAYEITFQGGKMYDASGAPFDTSDASTVFSAEGRAIFVMDENGDFYASKFQQVGRFHHSSLAGGEPVAAAGEMKVEQGVLILISNKSGHYRPGPTFMEQALDSLSRKGIGTGGVKRDFV
jgi:hypothetical protein